jgi:hypothetical protein
MNDSKAIYVWVARVFLDEDTDGFAPSGWDESKTNYDIEHCTHVFGDRVQKE